jgi:hypothetical protein
VSNDTNGPQRTLGQRAAKVGYEPSLPNFCNAANGCYHRRAKNLQQLLGF